MGIGAVDTVRLVGTTLPDIGVFGPYTYLVTEVLFGSFAAALLWRANAFRRAATTVAVLYPVAYVWDWYTLEVGVFSIPLRTGVELLGIPLEEHIFMVVVPSLVIGIHELVHGPPGDGTARPRGKGESATERSETRTGGATGDSARRSEGTTKPGGNDRL
nr:lycopene cyclase domain-containing protein [Haloprofundus salilacus]